MPLAEEYLKIGMLDEAAQVLTEGIKIHPAFHAARVTLGKVLLEQGEVALAKNEFEHVIEASPDNLLAHRKLAKIYRDERLIEKARVSCQAVLSVNPKDADMKSVLEELDRLERTSPEPPIIPVEVSTSAESQNSAAAETEPAVEKGALENPAAQESSPPIMDETPLGPKIEEVPVASDFPPVGSTSDSVVISNEPEAQPAPPESELGIAESGPTKNPPPADEIITEALADLYIKQGHYDKGIAMFRRLLANDPDNAALYKKLDETVELVKLLQEGPKLKKAVSVAPTEPPNATPAPAAETEEARRQAEKIRRLELWLESIKKDQKR